MNDMEMTIIYVLPTGRTIDLVVDVGILDSDCDSELEKNQYLWAVNCWHTDETDFTDVEQYDLDNNLSDIDILEMCVEQY